MRVYKSNRFELMHIVLIIASLYLCLFLSYNVKYIFYASIACFISILYLITKNYNKRLSKIILDEDIGVISFIFLSHFGNKVETHKCKMNDTICSIYKVASSKYFKVEYKGELIWDTSFQNFGIDDLQNLILHLNNYKNSM